MARASAASFLEHNPGYAFYIGIIDKFDEKLAPWYQGYKMVYADELELPFLLEMAQKYNITELSCAMKAFFCDYIMKKETEAEEILYLDSDLYFYSPLSELPHLHKEYDILLTPHIIWPMKFDGKQPDEIAYLATGTYNGGFFSVKKNENSKRFMEWWCNRMRDYCYYKLTDGLFVDQKWLNLVPVFFDKVGLIKHPGYNISYWNLHERNITINNNGYIVNGSFPLVFFHYSSINLKDGILFYKQQNRFNEGSLPLVKELFLRYRGRVYEEGYEATRFATSYFAEIHKHYSTALLKKSFTGRIKLWIKNNVPASTRNKLKNRLKGMLGS